MRKVEFPKQAGGYPEAGYSPVQSKRFGKQTSATAEDSTRDFALWVGDARTGLKGPSGHSAWKREALLLKIYILNT
jgi:hypothetical protein